MIFRLGELFCGPGGIAKGATTANINTPDWGITHQWANDYDQDTCNTYTHNICPNRPESVICGDIRQLDFNRLYQVGDIDALAFGFPCNDFSIVGEQKGVNGGYIDFADIKVIKEENLKRDYEVLKIRISEPFMKNISGRFSSYFGRQGQPDLDFEE